MKESSILNENQIIEHGKVVILKGLFYLFVKRIFDIVCAIIGCFLLIPICVFVKILYMLNGDFNKILFSQKRIGKNGKSFNFYKFRTMVVGADEILMELLKDPEIALEYNKCKKLKNDPRITKVGNFLRKSSLDELPQVINVLLGEMSLIGNRPYLPREKNDMGYYFDVIVKTKPGITGYWQVNGRSDTSFKKRLELEEFYSNNCGFRLDMKIFLRTFKAVFKSKGAL